VELLHIVVLAVVQGLTEFLPVSSSAHLILVPYLTGWPDQGLSFDVAVHVGTLTAVLLYFRAQLKSMAVDWCRSLYLGRHTAGSRLAWLVLLGTVPVGLCGLLAKPLIETYLRSPLVIAAASIVFGLLLGAVWRFRKPRRGEYQLTAQDALLIGLAQALALIPGTSRSGITLTAGLMLGLSPQAAARFSFLLSIPVIALAGVLLARDVHEAQDPLVWGHVLGGAVMAAVSAYLCIHYFLKLMERVGMMPFVIYRILLGLVIFVAFT
jgi:undecaprenyl-diphosphatase